MRGAQRYRATGDFEIVPLNRAWKVTNVDVGAAAAQIIATPLAQRRLVIIRNEDATDTVYIGPTNSVTDSGANQGWKIAPLEEESFYFGQDLDFFAIADNAATPIQIIEAG